MGRRQRTEKFREVQRVQVCDRCGLSFAGAGAFPQHLDDDGLGRGGTRCLPVHVFESVLIEVRGVWFARGTEPQPRRR
jgi:hypothetical protein